MLLVALCLIFGLMSKPMVVSFPFVLLLLDFWPLRRWTDASTGWWQKLWPLLREKIPLAVICLGIMVLTVWSQGGRGGIKAEAVHFPWYLKLFRVDENVWFYAHTFFSPAGLSLLYRTYPLDYLHVLTVGMLLLLVTGAVVYRARRQPWLAVGWFWFLLTLAPVAGIIRIGETTVADRYSYLPSAGLAIMVIYAAGAAIAYWPRLRTGVAVVIASWLMVLVLTTWADLPDWRNNYTIFDNAYRHGAHIVACDRLASELYQRKEYQRAIAVCDRGLAEYSNLAPMYQTRGASWLYLGDLDRALADFNRAIELNPTYSEPYFGRAVIHGQRKEYADAQADIQKYHQFGGNLDTSAVKTRPD
ncbi:MAG TPA: tetratricopeptide repeat protein, partial [Verrucomicrobiae bacterium]|nr:tetratricopeptide repeat protein [Verrucomicrobiae bacterium]